SFTSRPPPISTLFPYTTLFRSVPPGHSRHGAAADGVLAGEPVALSAHLAHCLSRMRRQLRRAQPGAAGAGRYPGHPRPVVVRGLDRKSTRLNSSHVEISYAVFC